jgi:hypothetical protein
MKLLSVFVCSSIMFSSALSYPNGDKDDAHECAQQLVAATHEPSDTARSQKMHEIFTKCRPHGTDAEQLKAGQEHADSIGDAKASFALGRYYGQQERKLAYHLTSGTVGVAAFVAGLCFNNRGNKK